MGLKRVLFDGQRDKGRGALAFAIPVSLQQHPEILQTSRTHRDICPGPCRCAVTKSCSSLCSAMDCSHTRLPCFSLSPEVCSNSCPLSQCCLLTVSSSAAPFVFCLQSFTAAASFSMSRLFTAGSQSIGASALASVLQ